MRHVAASGRLGLACVALAWFFVLTACASFGTPTNDDAEPNPAIGGANARTTVTRAELEHTPAARVEELLAGRVPGLHVIHNGSGDFTIRIRGNHTFGGGDSPLLVIDGLPIHASGFSRALSSMHPRDVERIEVLRDAGATASYGVQGAHGVILITTRRR